MSKKGFRVGGGERLTMMEVMCSKEAIAGHDQEEGMDDEYRLTCNTSAFET